MAKSQPFYAPCDGGLVLNSNNFELLNLPGVATKLRNYEVSLYGGYRRVNGFYKLGEGDAVQPTGSDDAVLGVQPYADGVVVVAGTGIYFTQDGINYIQVNKDTTEAGMDEASLAGASELPRANQDKACFAFVMGEKDHSTTTYGVLYIATKVGRIAHFHIDGDGVNRKYTYLEVDGTGAPIDAEWIVNHDGHLCAVDTVNEPGLIYYSDLYDFGNFAGSNAGSTPILDEIVGIKSFRADLIIFCRNSIYKLININDPNNGFQVLPVTSNLGCVNGQTIQEIGGDLIFLAVDGLRSFAATERIGDVELSSVSRRIQPIINSFATKNSTYIYSSVVLRSKNQYRLYTVNDAGATQGVCGTLRTNPDGNVSWQWSELRGFPVYSIASRFDKEGNEWTIHGGPDGYVYVHDAGNSFDGSPIAAQFDTPDIALGDLGMRHTLHYMNLSVTGGDQTSSFTITPRFNFKSNNIIQPSPITVNVEGSAGAIIGQMIIGAFVFPSGTEGTIQRIPMMGSGETVSFSFKSSDTNSPYTIHGYHLEAFPSGRK